MVKENRVSSTWHRPAPHTHIHKYNGTGEVGAGEGVKESLPAIHCHAWLGGYGYVAGMLFPEVLGIQATG